MSTAAVGPGAGCGAGTCWYCLPEPQFLRLRRVGSLLQWRAARTEPAVGILQEGRARGAALGSQADARGALGEAPPRPAFLL